MTKTRNKLKITGLIFTLVMMISLLGMFSLTVSAEDGSGTTGDCTDCDAYEPAEVKDGVYQIANLGNLVWFAQQVNGGNILAHQAQLTADITIDNSVIWTPITLSDNQPSSFNGAGYTITFVNTREESSFGLFGSYNYSVIENLYLAGSITCNNTANTGVLVNHGSGKCIISQVFKHPIICI